MISTTVFGSNCVRLWNPILPEITIPSEDLVALVALIGLVVSVSQKVGFQVGPLVETPLAHRALVRRLLFEDI